MASSCGSEVTGERQRAYALEWLATSGVVRGAATSQNPRSFRSNNRITIRRSLQREPTTAGSVTRVPCPVSPEIARRRPRRRRLADPRRGPGSVGPPVENLQRVEVGIDRVGALQVEHRHHHSVVQTPLQFSGGVWTTRNHPSERSSILNSMAVSAIVRCNAYAASSAGGSPLGPGFSALQVRESNTE